MNFFIQLLILLAGAFVFGGLAAHWKIPRVAGEILAGIVLGPTMFGAVAPLPGSLAQCALLAFLFIAGQETVLPRSRAEGKRILSVSVFGLAVPFGLSWAVAVAAPGLFGADGARPWFPFFLGTALSISALPVIARIFIDLNLERSALAMTVLSAAALDDLAGWIFFMVLVSRMKTSGPSGWLGLPGIFGAFLAGVLCQRLRSTAPAKILRHATLTVFAPLYFMGMGLQMNVRRDFAPVMALALLGIACVGKIAGAGLGARFAGLSWRDASAVGCAMNARGAMEIVLATVALQQGLITPGLHAGLIFVALATSLMAGPCLRAVPGNGLCR